MMIYKSRYTPNLENGKDVSFLRNEVVKYKLMNGIILEITIDSEIMKHSTSGKLGYESIFSDDEKRYFAESDRIVDWEGKGGMI